MNKKLLLTTLTTLSIITPPVYAGERMVKDDNQVYTSLDGDEYTIKEKNINKTTCKDCEYVGNCENVTKKGEI